jgi:serine/threonine protein kinase
MEHRRRFRIIKELSEGAFGKVYLAEMITGDNFKSVVAIKLLHGKWAGHEEIVQRSRDEARVLGLLHHRNIIRVEDLTSINGQCAVVMEYLNGVDMKTLCGYVRERGLRIPRRVVLEMASQIASALDAAFTHQPIQGGNPLELIHRDIKPSNVMLTCAGEVKVLDFGTAQARFDHREAHTQALAFGSAAYMAPERILGDQDNPWGDIFSLGITVYEMLSLNAFGKIQVRPERNAEHLANSLSQIDLGDLDEGCARELKAFLSRMLAYEPEDRPSAVEVVDFMEEMADRIQDGTIRRFCREVVTPCREMVEPEQDPNDPLAGSTLFEDTTTIAEHATVAGGNWMDETEEDDSQASSLRALGLDKGHVQAQNKEVEAIPTSKLGAHDPTGSSLHPLAVPEPRNARHPMRSGVTWIPDEEEINKLVEESTGGENQAIATNDEVKLDSDATGPVPAPEPPSHIPLPVDVKPSLRRMGEPESEEIEAVSTASPVPEEDASEEQAPVTSRDGLADEGSSLEKVKALSQGAPLPDAHTTTRLLESVIDQDVEQEPEPEVSSGGSGRIIAIIMAFIFMAGGLGFAAWKMGLIGKKSTSAM